MGVPEAPSPVLDLLCGGQAPEDTSSPLSAADLQACLDRVRLQSDEIKSKVYKAVSAHYGDFLALMTRANETSAQIADAEAEVARVLALLQSGATEPVGNKEAFVGDEILASSSELSKLRTQLAEKETAISALKVLASMHNDFRTLEEMTAQGRFLEAADSAVELQGTLSTLPEAEGVSGSSRVFGALQQQYNSRLEQLQGALDSLVSTGLLIDPSAGELTVRAQISTDSFQITLAECYEALDRLGLLNARLVTLGDSLFSSIIHSLLEDKALTLTEQIKAKSATLRWTSGNSKELASPEAVYTNLLTLIRFLGKHVLKGRMLQLGKVMWPRLADVIIQGPLGRAVPSEVSDLVKFQEIQISTSQFEDSLIAESFLPPDSSSPADRASPKRLSAFAADVDHLFALKKKQKILSEARNVLLQPDWCYNTVIVGVEEGTSKDSCEQEQQQGEDKKLREGPSEKVRFFAFERCAVSGVAKSLVEIARAALEESSSATPRTALELYQAARGALQLYRAVVPVQRAVQIETVPQIAMLAYNDALYLAHQCLTLGLQYRSILPETLQSLATFADLVVPLRQLAASLRSRAVAIQLSEFNRELDGAKGFQSTDDLVRFRDAQRAIKQVSHTLGHLVSVWQPVLSPGVLHQVMLALLEGVVSRVVTEVLALPDISVEETEQLRLLLTSLQSIGPPIIARVVSMPPDSEAKAITKVAQDVPSWEKLRLLTDLLDMSLVSINEAWESGMLTGTGFSATEVQHLVQAIFSETPLRKEVLERVKLGT